MEVDDEHINVHTYSYTRTASSCFYSTVAEACLEEHEFSRLGSDVLLIPLPLVTCYYLLRLQKSYDVKIRKSGVDECSS